jgi:hypothetical protein
LDKTLKLVTSGLLGAGSSSAATNGTKRKDGSSSGPVSATGPGTPGQGVVATRDADNKTCPYTMNFILVRRCVCSPSYFCVCVCVTYSVLFFPSGLLLSVAVSHDGQWVVSGSKSGVQFWDA